MKYFLKRILLFSSPIILYILAALIIDPYNIIHKEHNQKLIELKSQISYKLNYPLYKLKEYSDNPTDVILLGDSRTNKLNPKTFDQLTNLNTTNLAYGGGTLPEIIETFWYAAKIHPLKQVYIGINFNLYSANNNRSRVTEAIELKNSPFSCLFSQYCFKSTMLIIASLVTNKTINVEKPNYNRNEFWKYQLESSANNFYRDYKYPTSYHKDLIKISDYCKKNNIKLIFFIPPTHTDLQHKVNEFKLESSEKVFKTDLEKLGLFYDFDYPNEMTENKDNFSDPFHYNDTLATIVINEIVTGNIKNARTHN